MKPNEYVIVHEPMTDLNEQEQAVFLLSLQKAILYSLEKRGLLTGWQRELCVAELEQQYERSLIRRRNAVGRKKQGKGEAE